MKTDQELIKWALEESPEPIIKNPFLKLALRSTIPPMEVLPEEFDELSPREEEYYKEPPFSTRKEYQKGQLVQPGPEGVRQGYARPGGNPEFGKTITGTLRKGTVQAKTQPKLDFLKELIDRENSLYRKNKTIAELLNEAGWKGGWDSVPTSGETRKLIHKYNKKLLTTQQKMDNYVNNVMLAEDALVKDFRNPKQHLAKKFGVSKSFMDKWSSPDHYNSKVWAENKKLFTGLSNEFSFNKYKLLPDGTPRLMHDYSVIKYNQLPYTQGLHSGSSREKFILESAHRHNKYAKHAGIDSQITFINKNYELLPMNQWQFIKDGKLYSLDPSIDNVEFRGQTYKNNYLNRVDAAKLYKKDFGEVYKVFDELDVYMDTEVIGKDGKPIKLDKVLQERAHKLTGKKGYYKRRFMDIDHADIMKNPFGELRLLDATTNKRAGIIKRLEKYRNNPKLLASKLDEIGYNRKFNNTDELIKFYSKEAGVVPKTFTETIRPRGGPQLSSLGGVFDEALKSKAVKKGWGAFRKVGGPWEAGFIGADYINNLDSMDPNTAFQMALENATLGIYKGGRRAQWEDFQQAGKELGHNKEDLGEVKSIMDLEKMLNGEKEILEQMIAYNQEEGARGLRGKFPEQEIAWRKEVVAKLENKFNNQLETFWGQENANDIVKNYEDTVGYVARQEYNKSVNDALLDKGRKHRVNPEMGPIGSPLWESITDWRSFLPQNLMETTDPTRPIVRGLRKLPGFLGDIWDPTSEQAKLSAMSDKEREQRAKDLNIQEQYYHPVTGSTMTAEQMEPYYERFYAGGGIANVRRPNAIPPVSGPMPQGGGLSTMFNRVKPW